MIQHTKSLIRMAIIAVMAPTVLSACQTTNSSGGGVTQNISDSTANFFDSVFSPTKTKIRELLKQEKFDEAATLLFEKAKVISADDLAELKPVVSKHFLGTYEAKLLIPVSKLTIGGDEIALREQFYELFKLEQYQERIKNEAVFYGAKTSDLNSKINNWFSIFFDYLGKKPELYASFSELETMKELKYDIRSECINYLKKMVNPGMVSFCFASLERFFENHPYWNSQREKMLLNDLVVRAQLRTLMATTDGAFEKLQKSSEVLRGIYGPKLSLKKLPSEEAKNFLSDFLPKLENIQLSKLNSVLKKTEPQFRNKIYIAYLRKGVKQENKKLKVPSRYVSGSRVVPNPEYLRAQRNYQSQVNADNQCEARWAVERVTNPYAVYLCGWTGMAVNRAAAHLNSLSPTLTQDITSSYSFLKIESKIFITEKTFVFVFSKNRGKYLGAEFDTSREKSFVFADGLHDADTTQKSSFFYTDADVKKFIEQEVEPKYFYEKIVEGKFSPADGMLTRLLGDENSRKATKQLGAQSASVSASQGQLGRFLDESIVVVQVRNGLGTGFYVRDRFIVTNAHVVQDQSIVNLKNKSGKTFSGMVLAKDSVLDLALIGASDPGFPIPLSPSTPSAGQEAFALGHPKGLEFSLTKGVISAVRELPVGVGGAVSSVFIQTDVPINSGNSGGPLIVGNKVVGVNTFKRIGANTEGLGFALSSTALREWLAKNLK